MAGTYTVTVTEALGPELITGGSFTTGTTVSAPMSTAYTNTTSGNTNGGYYVQASASSPGNYGNSGCLSGGPSGGGFFIGNGANNGTSIALEQTTIAVTSGSTYRFSCWVGNVYTHSNTPIIDVYVNGVKRTTLNFASGCNWTSYTLDFTATSNNTSFKFIDARSGVLLGLGDVFGIDDVSLKQVYTCTTSNTTDVVVSTGCTAGTIAPTLTATTKMNACPLNTVDLTTISATNLPPSTTLTWHTGPLPASNSNKLSLAQAQTVAAGTYYAAFFDATNNCYSGATNGAAATTVTAAVNGCDVNLQLSKTGDKTSVLPNQNITYTLTLTNTGVVTATNVKVKDQLPAGVTFVSATPSTGSYDAITGIWLVPSIATGSQTLSITVLTQ